MQVLTNEYPLWATPACKCSPLSTPCRPPQHANAHHAPPLWPVFSRDPWTTDDGTYHEAVTVTKGVKYAANFWIHMFEFQQALLRGCDNEDYWQDMLLEDERFGKGMLAKPNPSKGY